VKIIPSSRRNRYIAGVIILLVAIALIVWLASWLSVPSSEIRDWFEIRDWYDLSAIGNNLCGSYILMNDLDSTTAGYDELASPTANGGKGWEPLGILGGTASFTGTFDGRGYEIRDLFVNRPDQTRIGLFDIIDHGAVVENLGVANVTVVGDRLVGGLVALNKGTISNSYSTGSVTGNDEVGGLVGDHSWGALHNCYSIASVTGGNEVGGLLGRNDATTVNDSYLEGTVSSSYSKGNVTGQSSVGGLVGAIDHSIIVEDAYSGGSVTGNNNVVGLVASDEFSIVSNSYSTASVTGSWKVGGLVGHNHGGTVGNSYSIGNVTGDEYVGGLVGWNEYGTVSNSFWDIETSGQATSDGGTGKTTAEMQYFATFIDTETEGLDEPWDLTTVSGPDRRNPSHIWNIVYRGTYPFLSWHFCFPHVRISPILIETMTTPSGYLDLTVSPAKVCANIGEQIEIRCTIQPMVFTPIEISSVDVLLFDSYDSMVRERAMTMDSAWSAHTVYKIVGDEAYYKLKVSFTTGYAKPEEHSEYGAHSFPIVVSP